MTVADRATISNMSPEFGATATLFPVDDQTLRYLRTTGRDPQLVDLVERYTKAQGLCRTDAAPEPQFDDLLELDLSTIEPSLAGPRRPQDRVPLQAMRSVFRTVYADRLTKEEDATAQVAIGRMLDKGDRVDTASVPQEGAKKTPEPRQNGHSKEVLVELGGVQAPLTNGSVAIAAITSCTNTSNPSVMIAAGLLAKHAVERGLSVKPTVKTSLAPGSRAVMQLLDVLEGDFVTAADMGQPPSLNSGFPRYRKGKQKRKKQRREKK